MEIRRGVWVELEAWGHPNVRATHRSTVEVTVEDYLTPRGDCIVAVRAETGLAGLPEELKGIIRSGGLVFLVVCAGGRCDSVVGVGHPGLGLSDPYRMIARKSAHVDDRTLMICANKSARDIDRRIVSALRRGARARILVGAVEVPGLEFCLKGPNGAARSNRNLRSNSNLYP